MFNKCIGTGIKLYPDHSNPSAITTYFLLLVKAAQVKSEVSFSRAHRNPTPQLLFRKATHSTWESLSQFKPYHTNAFKWKNGSFPKKRVGLPICYQWQLAGSGISYEREKYDKTCILTACLGSLKRESILRVYLNYKNKKVECQEIHKTSKEAGNN